MDTVRLFLGWSFLFFSVVASGEEVNWVDWTSASVQTVQGHAISRGEKIQITYDGAYLDAQISGGGTNYWIPDTAYINNAVVDNAPPDSDIIQIQGGPSRLTHTVTFSEPIVNPVMAILSLGQPNIVVTYNFGGEEFSILSSGSGWWGGDPEGSLFKMEQNVLTGVEGNGVIQFEGVYSSITWTVPRFENWHGFQIGFERLESQTHQ